jgi:hypothetical protein
VTVQHGTVDRRAGGPRYLCAALGELLEVEELTSGHNEVAEAERLGAKHWAAIINSETVPGR